MNLIFATNNAHKVEEIRAALPPSLTILTLKEAGIEIDIPEPYNTLEENAIGKARTIFGLTKTSCFSEDTGLEVQALNGAPGVHSARYAGEDRLPENNIAKLLFELQNEENRAAHFKTVICLILKEKEYLFEGICAGTIIKQQAGADGFGYDPIFVPQGSDKTFAQMGMAEKNRYSHRRKALDKLVAFLNNKE
jgi:XTP/dITP diphosphohydrolase